MRYDRGVRRSLIAIVGLAAGCGRFAFDPSDAATPTCTGHDEDGDGFPDACDVCPTIVNPDQADRGERDAGQAADGVGDACDPRPAMTGDYVMRFESHEVPANYALTLVNEWRPDALRLGSVTFGGSGGYDLPALPTRIEVRARIVELSTTEILWFGVWYNMEVTAGDPKVFASGSEDPSIGSLAFFTLKEQAAVGMERFGTGDGPLHFMVGDVYHFIVETALATGGTDHISVTSGATTWSGELQINVPRYAPGFMEASRSVIDFDFFIAYGLR